MNLHKLNEAQANFLQLYPKGFDDPGMQSIRKKHNVDKLILFAQEQLTKANCSRAPLVIDAIVKIVSRSSMVSMFEKPRFKEFVESLSTDEKEALAYGFEQRLFGRKQQGFEDILGMMAHHKVAKWSLMSVIPFYVAPRREVFVKPTTAKGIINFLEIPDLQYKPTPSWAFYKGFQRVLAEVKKNVSPSLSPNYAALSGFLMMSLPRE